MIFQFDIITFFVIASFGIHCNCKPTNKVDFEKQIGQLLVKLANPRHEPLVNQMLEYLSREPNEDEIITAEDKIVLIGKKLSNPIFHDNVFTDRLLAILNYYKKNGGNNKDGQYIGCFQDHEKQRMFRGFTTMGEMTNRKCIDLCKNYGFVYAGTQAHKYCHCGNSAPQPNYNKKLKDDDCNLTCTGSSEKCGGHYKMSVYKTGIEQYRFDSNKMIGESSSYSENKWRLEN